MRLFSSRVAIGISTASSPEGEISHPSLLSLYLPLKSESSVASRMFPPPRDKLLPALYCHSYRISARLPLQKSDTDYPEQFFFDTYNEAEYNTVGLPLYRVPLFSILRLIQLSPR